MKKKSLFLIAALVVVFIFFSNFANAQPWQRVLNPGAPNLFGTSNLFPITIFTNSIWRATFFSTGGFAINRTALGTTTPGALLHIGDAFGPPGSGGHRTWMNVGTFCWQVTDNMYVDLKDETALFGVDGNILEQFIV